MVCCVKLTKDKRSDFCLKFLRVICLSLCLSVRLVKWVLVCEDLLFYLSISSYSFFSFSISTFLPPASEKQKHKKTARYRFKVQKKWLKQYFDPLFIILLLINSYSLPAPLFYISCYSCF
jgi:hypothetical protein